MGTASLTCHAEAGAAVGEELSSQTFTPHATLFLPGFNTEIVSLPKRRDTSAPKLWRPESNCGSDGRGWRARSQSTHNRDAGCSGARQLYRPRASSYGRQISLASRFSRDVSCRLFLETISHGELARKSSGGREHCVLGLLDCSCTYQGSGDPNALP